MGKLVGFFWNPLEQLRLAEPGRKFASLLAERQGPVGDTWLGTDMQFH
jgi:hypothetical protein